MRTLYNEFMKFCLVIGVIFAVAGGGELLLRLLGWD